MRAIANLEAYFTKGNERPGYIKQAGVGAPLVVAHNKPISRAYAKFMDKALRARLGAVVAHCTASNYILQVHLSALHNQVAVLADAHALLKPLQLGVIVTLYGATNPQLATWVIEPVLPFPKEFDGAVNRWCANNQSQAFSLLDYSSHRLVGRMTGTMAFMGAGWEAKAFCEALNLNCIRTVKKEEFGYE